MAHYQQQLALFPSDTKMVNSCLGIQSDGDLVYYLHNGSPIYCHSKSDQKMYRFICGNLITSRLCTISELSSALGVGRKNIERYAKTLREEGSAYFFKEETRGGHFKLTNDDFALIQSYLDVGYSYARIATQLNIVEGTIRYHITHGRLKKK